MKSWQSTLFIVLALLVGLGGGYLLAGLGNQTSSEAPTAEEAPAHTHDGVETYTCSMHPQVRQEEPGQCPICGMDLIPLSEARGGDPLQLEMTPQAVRLAQVQTTRIGDRGSAENTLRLNGTIRPDERRTAALPAHVAGRIERLFVTFEGEQVRRGQAIAEIYAPKFVSAQRELLEAVKWKTTNPRLYEAARRKLQNWLVSEAFLEALERSGQIEQHITITAESAGVVVERHVAVGDYVDAGQALFQLVDLDHLWVLLDAYEEDLAKVDLGDRVTFTTPALPDQSFESRIAYIDPAIDPETRVASLRAEVHNPGRKLKPAMFVRAKVQARSPTPASLIVPKTAVLWTGKRSVVYVALPDNPLPTYEYREVELGESLGDAYLVMRGLEAGEEVVTHGAFAIDAAAQLNNQRSMINSMVQMTGEHANEHPDYTAAAPEAFHAQLEGVAAAYLNLKDALVASDADRAREIAASFLDSLEQVDMALLSGAAHNYWMDQRNALEAHARSIASGEGLPQQRKPFEFLSEALINTIRAFGTTELLYVQHCPMAFNDQGADWISRESEIRNPYFGDEMLACGAVTDSLRL